MKDLSEWWRQISEYLPPWARVTFLSSVPIGEGLHQLANLLHPSIDYAAVSEWGWPIFGMFIAFPPVFLWRIFGRRILRVPDTFEMAQEYILIIKMALKEAGLSKTEQQFQWRAVIQKLADEIRVGVKPPPVADLDLSMALDRSPSRSPDAPA